MKSHNNRKYGSGLFVDFYELTMAQGFYLGGLEKKRTVFDYFFRGTPFGGGYVIFAGLNTLIEALSQFRYSGEDIDYLAGLNFKPEFLEYLAGFRFKGNIQSVIEGEVVFPAESLLRVEGNIVECQLIETLVLNTLNLNR